jgi:predicted nucleic acid-binding protein
MIIPDANLLLYAVDKECADHTKAASWWRQALHGSE